MSYPHVVALYDQANSLGIGVPILNLNNDWDANGYFWTWQSLDGWWGTNVRTTTLDPANSESGQVVAEIRKSSKPVVLRGFCGQSNGNDYWRAASLLETRINLISDITNFGTLVVSEPDGDAHLDLYNVGQIQIARQGDLRTVGMALEVITGFTFQLSLFSPDGIKY